MKVQDPEGHSKYLQVKTASLSQRIFDGKSFKTRGVDVTEETYAKLLNQSPKPHYVDERRDREFVVQRYYPTPLTSVLRDYSDIKDLQVDDVALQGLREDRAVKKLELRKKLGEPIYLIYRGLEDNKLYLMQFKEGKCSRLSILPEEASQWKVKDLNLYTGDLSESSWLSA